MSSDKLISELMQLLNISKQEAEIIINDARLQRVTDTNLDRQRRREFIGRLPTYQQAMRFA